ncbi:MAG TPA: hypothetical protein VGQ46_01225 [Thermoanaerobaculia bacterium]|jgi:hypothetical protein|nr:hypothetical protein [Thermoanaerobaculia bacterium]
MKAKAVSAGIPRREFLRISSVAAVGVAIVTMSDGSLFAATSSGIVPLMDVGYAPSLPAAGFSVALSSADSILSPDPRFISTGARVGMIAAKRADRHRNAPGGIGVDALFAANHRQPENPLHFNFFSITGRTDNDTVSGPVSFNMPVPSTSGVTLMIKRQRPAASQEPSPTPPPIESEISPLTLSLGNVAGPKLARGVYVLAFREEESDSMSNWSRLSLAHSDNGYYISGATFSYVLLNVDYAPEAEAVPAPDRRHAARH